MIKVVEILDVNLNQIICGLSNNDIKRVKLQPLISNHKHLKGIEKLRSKDYIRLVEIGMLGEIFWPETIISSAGDTCNYDISSEYIYHFGEDFDLESKEIAG
ncbi:MAG: hypothetical protein WAT22_07540 [Saprospiraceae bacterium]